jgi:hypothetical protein
MVHLEANFPESLQKILAPTFKDRCLQPQYEVTEWVNIHIDIFQRIVNDHGSGLWQQVKEHWIKGIQHRY